MRPVSEQDPEIQNQIQKIGNNIRDSRKSLKQSQTDLALDIGTDKSWISHIENGEVDPKVSTLIKISQMLGIPLNVLVNTEEGGGLSLKPELLARAEKATPEQKEAINKALNQSLGGILELLKL